MSDIEKSSAQALDFSDIQFRRNVEFVRNRHSVFLSLSHAFCQQILYLAIHRSEIILGPGSDGVVELGGQTKRHLFLAVVRHLIETAGIDNGLGIPVAAQYHQKVGYHSSFALLVQFHNFLFGKAA